MKLELLFVLALVLVFGPALSYGYFHQDRQILVSPLWLETENELHIFNIFILEDPQMLAHDVKKDIRYDLKRHMHVIPLYLVEKFPEDSINNEQFGCINGKTFGCLTDENILIINGHQYDKVGDLTLSAHLIKRVYEREMLW